MFGKSLASRYGANRERGRMGQSGYEKRKGDGVIGAGGRGVLQSLKWRGDGVWVVAHRELMSRAAGFKGHEFRASAGVWHPTCIPPNLVLILNNRM